jgi:hypothetical protein
MLKSLSKLIFACGLSIIISACDDADELLDELDPTPSPSASASPSPTPRPTNPSSPAPTRTPRPTATPVPSSGNPIASGPQNFLDGANGNLWKPVSENNGNLVVLFEPKWKKLFSNGCSVELKDGSREELYCGGVLECFTNGNRMTLRSNVKCSRLKEVKVTCEERKQTVTFTVPQAKRAQICSRHD